jgi:trehalose-6-phosphate synthase
LSQFSGCNPGLTGTLIVNAHSPDDIKDAMDTALNMKLEVRRERLNIAYSYIEDQSTLKWSLGFLRDLKRVQLKNAKASANTKMEFLGFK